MNYLDRVQNLQKKVESNNLEKARLEERENNLEEEEDKLLEQLKVYEITESDLEGETERIKEEIEKELLKCEEILK